VPARARGSGGRHRERNQGGGVRARSRRRWREETHPARRNAVPCPDREGVRADRRCCAGCEKNGVPRTDAVGVPVALESGLEPSSSKLMSVGTRQGQLSQNALMVELLREPGCRKTRPSTWECVNLALFKLQDVLGTMILIDSMQSEHDLNMCRSGLSELRRGEVEGERHADIDICHNG
jgi:hypothetical protein